MREKNDESMSMRRDILKRACKSPMRLKDHAPKLFLRGDKEACNFSACLI